MKPEDKELLKTEILKYVQRENYDRNGVMSDSDDDPTMILNRCNVDEYKYSIMWKGKAE